MFEIISNTNANVLNLHIDKGRKYMLIKTLFNHICYKANFKPKRFTADAKCNGTVIKLSQNKGHSLSDSKFKFALDEGESFLACCTLPT